MNPVELSIEQDTNRLVSQIDTFTHVQSAKSISLREHVPTVVSDYHPTKIYTATMNH